MPLNSRLVRVKTNASWVGKAGTRLALRRNGRGRVLLDLAWRTARMAQTRRMGKVARKVQRPKSAEVFALLPLRAARSQWIR